MSDQERISPYNMILSTQVIRIKKHISEGMIS